MVPDRSPGDDTKSGGPFGGGHISISPTFLPYFFCRNTAAFLPHFSHISAVFMPYFCRTFLPHFSRTFYVLPSKTCLTKMQGWTFSHLQWKHENFSQVVMKEGMQNLVCPMNFNTMYKFTKQEINLFTSATTNAKVLKTACKSAGYLDWREVMKIYCKLYKLWIVYHYHVIN